MTRPRYRTFSDRGERHRVFYKEALDDNAFFVWTAFAYNPEYRYYGRASSLRECVKAAKDALRAHGDHILDVWDPHDWQTGLPIPRDPLVTMRRINGAWVTLRYQLEEEHWRWRWTAHVGHVNARPFGYGISTEVCMIEAAKAINRHHEGQL